MIKESKQTVCAAAVCFLFLFIFIFSFTSCGELTGEIYDFREGDAAYTADFGDGVTGECVRRGSRSVLTMTSPEHLAGISVEYDTATGICELCCEGMRIALSPEVSAGLCKMFALLDGTDGGEGLPVKSADGDETAVRSSCGAVMLDSEGTPVAVRIGEREIRISEWKKDFPLAENPSLNLRSADSEFCVLFKLLV